MAFISVFGNLTEDPKVETLGSSPVVNFHVAVEGPKGSFFWKCVLVGKKAQAFADEYEKGDLLMVEGKPVGHFEGKTPHVEIWVDRVGLSHPDFQ